MSFTALKWAYEQPLECGEKFVLVSLASMADEAESCYPGQRTLAEMTGQGERTVRRHLAALELRGAIKRERRSRSDGSRTSDRYVIQVGETLPIEQPAKLAGSARQPRGETGHIGLPATVAGGETTGQFGRDNRPSTTGQPATVAGHEYPVNNQIEEPDKDVSKIGGSVSAIRQDVERICEHLSRRMVENGCNPPKITQAWRTAARLMIDRDKHTEEQIHKAIDWCQDDEFWRANIHSTTKLRKQYDTLRLQATRSRTSQAKDPNRHPNAEWRNPEAGVKI